MLLSKQQLGAHVATSDDEERYVLNHIRIRPDGVVLATSGHVAIRVKPKNQPNEEAFPTVPGLVGEDPLEAVHIPADVAKSAQGIIPKASDLISFDRARLLVNGHVVMGATDLREHQLVMVDQAAGIGKDFPNLNAVIPPPSREGVFSVTLNARLLELIAKYARTFDHANLPGIRFTFYNGPDAAVRFAWSDEHHDVEGALMPIREQAAENAPEGGTAR